jgi:hypothetical protein
MLLSLNSRMCMSVPQKSTYRAIRTVRRPGRLGRWKDSAQWTFWGPIYLQSPEPIVNCDTLDVVMTGFSRSTVIMTQGDRLPHFMRRIGSVDAPMHTIRNSIHYPGARMDLCVWNLLREEMPMGPP